MKISVKKDSIKGLNGFIGVYIFSKKRRPIYVGKSINVKARLLSHLENSKIDPKERRVIETADGIECIETDSEFKALLLEARLIKTHHPKYNVRWKDDRGYLYIKITNKDPYPKILLARKETEKKSLHFGPFSSIQSVNEVLRELRKIFPFCTQKKIGKQSCFYSKIGLCNPCPNLIRHLKEPILKKKLKREYRKNIRQVIRLLKGDVDRIQNNLYKKLRTLTKNEDYETAIQVRNLILRLESLSKRQRFDPADFSTYKQGKEGMEELIHLLSLFYPRLTSVSRVEGYDISNLGQKQATASMVVFTQGEPNKASYRKFKIRNHSSASDFERLEEVLQRRFKNNWPTPDLLVVDGGKPQVRILMKGIASLNLDIPIIGIAKNPDRLIIGIENLPTIRPKLYNSGFNLIRYLRDEAHRFAKKYHLQLRKKETFF